MVEFEGKKYRPMTREDVAYLIGRQILVYKKDFSETRKAVVKVEKVTEYWSHTTLVYASPTPWATVSGYFYHTEVDTWFYVPIDFSPADLCYCKGPAEDRWCYDTNKVESLCARCRKRKGAS